MGDPHGGEAPGLELHGEQLDSRITRPSMRTADPDVPGHASMHSHDTPARVARSEPLTDAVVHVHSGGCRRHLACCG